MPRIATALERIQDWDERVCIRFNRAMRVRPLLAAMRAISWLGNGVFWYALMLVLLVFATDALDQFSFPSGHMLHAVGFSLVACIHCPWLAALLVPLTLLVAASRVVLGLHYPSDVIAGGALGAVIAALSFKL